MWKKTTFRIIVLMLSFNLLTPALKVQQDTPRMLTHLQPNHDLGLASQIMNNSISELAPPHGSIIALYERTAENLLEISNTTFTYVPDLFISFTTAANMHLQIIASATSKFPEGYTMDFMPVVDGRDDLTSGPYAFGGNSKTWDCRTAQWILRDLPGGNHTVAMRAKIAGDGTGKLGKRSITLAIIDPSIIPPTWYGNSDKKNIDINNTKFEEVPDMRVMFETNTTMDMAIMFSATIVVTNDYVLEIRPSVDGDLEIAKGPWSFASNAWAYDCRTAQWILEDLPPGNHTVSMYARVTTGFGTLGWRSMTISLTNPLSFSELSSSLTTLYSTSLPGEISINSADFHRIPGITVAFNTSSIKDLQIIFSSTILTDNETTIEIVPMIDNEEPKISDPSLFGAITVTNDSRCIQWIVRDIPRGYHNVSILARVVGREGIISWPSMITRLMPSQSNVAPVPVWFQWWFWMAVVISLSVVLSLPILNYYLKRKGPKICWSHEDLEEDFARRGKKVKKWNDKYGASLNPSNNTEELVKKMGLQDQD
jgi:hypothetical protein